MYRIRHYAELIHPDHFKKSGWRGTFIVCLNWLRWKLEVFTQKQVVKWFAKWGQLPEAQESEILRTFKLDTQAEALLKEMTSPLHEVPPPPEVPRAERYADGAVKTALDVTVGENGSYPMRPKSLENLIGQYGFNARSRRYAHAKRFQVADPDGDFVPVEPEKKSEAP
jgi:hypothetical protein